MKMFDVIVYYPDDREFGHGMFATVAIGEYDGGNDDGIFYWFKDEAEYLEVLANGTDEFRIESVA